MWWWEINFKSFYTWVLSETKQISVWEYTSENTMKNNRPSRTFYRRSKDFRSLRENINPNLKSLKLRNNTIMAILLLISRELPKRWNLHFTSVLFVRKRKSFWLNENLVRLFREWFYPCLHISTAESFSFHCCLHMDDQALPWLLESTFI